MINCAAAIFSGCFYRWIVYRKLTNVKQKLETTDNERKVEWYSTVRAVWLVRKWRKDVLGYQSLQHLFILTLGSVTTVVGVCMLMKHDGMDLRGWVGVFVKGNDIPYPLCPMLGECLQFNATKFTPTLCDEGTG